MKLGSLFDGSGGFPLAGTICGIEPRWAAEVEPYPIAVTRSRFPHMKHLGDVSKVSGADIEPVDIITFGSPCQDLSVAGKRAGLKHADNGADETTRSGLFMEAVRIIKEMRKATNSKYPTFALWENVPGAFSSNGGEDFRTVLAELIGVAQPGAAVPEIPRAGWAYADSWAGCGWSLAWRVFDAQYWGVPQRRRRIHLVVDFAGGRARQVLFEREGLRGHTAQSGAEGQGTAADAQNGAGADDCEVEGGCLSARNCQPDLQTIAFAQNQREEVRNINGIAVALNAEPGTHQQTYIAYPITGTTKIYDARGNSQTVAAGKDKVESPICGERKVFRKTARPHNAAEAPNYEQSECANTLNTFDTGETRANELVVEVLFIHDMDAPP